MDAKGRAELGDLLKHRSGLAPPADGADLTSLQVTTVNLGIAEKGRHSLSSFEYRLSCVRVKVGGFGGACSRGMLFGIFVVRFAVALSCNWNGRSDEIPLRCARSNLLCVCVGCALGKALRSL